MYSGPRPGTPTGAPPSRRSPAMARRYAGLRVVAWSSIASAWLTAVTQLPLSLYLVFDGAAEAFSSPSTSTAPALGTGALPGLGGTGSGLDGPGIGLGGASGGPGGGIASQGLAGMMSPQSVGNMKLGVGLALLFWGTVMFLIQLGGGLLIYVALDTESNTRLGAAAMVAMARRMGITEF